MITLSNIALEPTPNSVRSSVAPAIGRGSPRALALDWRGGCMGRLIWRGQH
jgi:hypothetical protein